jgi:hypothetical protein
MRCEEAAEYFADYLAGEAGSVSSSIESHLASCTRCRNEMESLGALWNRLGAVPAESPSPGMRVRFQAMLEGYEAGLGLTSGQFAAPRRASWLRNWLRPALALQFGYAVVLLIAGGVAGQFLPFRRTDTGEITQLRSEIHGMRELVTVSLLQQDSASERLQGVSWSRQVHQPDEKVLEALVGAMDHDPSVNVRLAAVDALYRFSDRPAARQGLVQALIRQDSPLVQIALIDAIVDLQEKQAAEALRRLSSDGGVNQAVRERAKWGLKQLS